MNGWWIYPDLFLASLVAGFVDSVAGGGGLITLPMLLAVGLNPPLALGTNKLQSTFGSGSASLIYASKGIIAWRECVAGFVWTFIGAGAGAWEVQRLPADLLGKIIPCLLTVILLVLLANPKLGHREAVPRLSRPVFHFIFGLGLGFYDGFFGPGTGTFWAMAYVLLLGLDLTRATGQTKVMNFASNLSALLFFCAGGKVDYGIGLVMGGGQFIGGRLGSKMVVARGVKFVRTLLLAVAFAITIKLFWSQWR
jgi:uncharacterized membrane protein YfcA